MTRNVSTESLIIIIMEIPEADIIMLASIWSVLIEHHKQWHMQKGV